MKITIEDYNEINGGNIEVDYFVNNGELKTVEIDREDLLKDIADNDLNVWSEDKWNYSRGEHYTVDSIVPADEYLEENMKDVILGRLEQIERRAA